MPRPFAPTPQCQCTWKGRDGVLLSWVTGWMNSGFTIQRWAEHGWQVFCGRGESAVRWGVVVVLKGSPSVVASPSGTVAVGAYANAVLATAGSGDVLAGVVASLAAQGASPWESAVAGMTLHALAGEAWRAQHGSAGLRASDLSAWLPVARRMLDR
ncbi:MAG: hypothetical protein EBU40_12565 [Proteobacteria bacterium]|nr:hypothetical protein [Pseudomonadota bacterium]